MELHSENIKSKKQPDETELTEEEKAENALFPWSPEGCKERMELINQYVKDVSSVTQVCRANTPFSGETQSQSESQSLLISCSHYSLYF